MSVHPIFDKHYRDFNHRALAPRPDGAYAGAPAMLLVSAKPKRKTPDAIKTMFAHISKITGLAGLETDATLITDITPATISKQMSWAIKMARDGWLSYDGRKTVGIHIFLKDTTGNMTEEDIAAHATATHAEMKTLDFEGKLKTGTSGICQVTGCEGKVYMGYVILHGI